MKCTTCEEDAVQECNFCHRRFCKKETCVEYLQGTEIVMCTGCGDEEMTFTDEDREALTAFGKKMEKEEAYQLSKINQKN